MEDKVTVRPSVSFEVEKIIGMSIGSGNVRIYHVQWAPTWVSGMNLVGCEHLIEHFIQHQNTELLPGDIGNVKKEHHIQLQPDHIQGLDQQEEQQQPKQQQQQQHQQQHQQQEQQQKQKQRLHQQKQQQQQQLEQQQQQKPPLEQEGGLEKQLQVQQSQDQLSEQSEKGQLKYDKDTEGFDRREDVTGREVTMTDTDDLESLTGELVIHCNAHELTTKEVALEEQENCQPRTLKNDLVHKNLIEAPGSYHNQSVKVISNNRDLQYSDTSPEGSGGDQSNLTFEWIKVEDDKDSSDNSSPSPFPCNTGKIPHASEEIVEDACKESDGAVPLSPTPSSSSDMFLQNMTPVRGATFVVEQPEKGSPYVKRYSQESTTSQGAIYRQGSKKMYECVECRKTFSNRGNLNTHLRLHTGEKPYRCSECDKCFSRKHHLNDHYSRFHTGDLVYHCTECTAAFTRKHHLTEHKRTHRRLEMASMVQI